MILFDRHRDGSLIIQTTARAMWELWNTTDRQWRCLLEDGRPAVYQTADVEGDCTYTTFLPTTWERIMPHFERLAKARGFQEHITPTRRDGPTCGTCNSEMTLKTELETVWVWKCPKCLSADVWDKRLVGGTIGAGEKEKT